MCRKIFIVLFVCVFVSAHLFAFAFVPGKARTVQTEATMETGETAIDIVPVPCEDSQKAQLEEAIELLNNSKTLSRDKATADAVKALKISYEDLKTVNSLTLGALEEAEKRLKKESGLHLIVGAGTCFDIDDYRIHGLLGIRKGSWLILGEAGLKDIKSSDFKKENMYGSVNLAYEF